MEMKGKRQIFLFYAGVFLLHAGFQGVFALVSSLNIKEGLGTTSLSVAFAVSLPVILLTPFLSEVVGIKRFLLLSEIFCLLYVMANSISSYYTLIPAGFLFGFGEAVSWTMILVIGSYFSHKSLKHQFARESLHTGYLFAATQGGRCFSNAIAFLCLFVDRQISNSFQFNRTLNLDVCGTNDCQISNITTANFQQYTPIHKATRYVTIAVFALLLTASLFTHILCIPNYISNQLSDLSKGSSRNLAENGLTAVITPDNYVSADGDLLTKSFEEDAIRKPTDADVKIKAIDLLKMCTKSMVELFLQPKHLLIVLMPVYVGTTMAFVMSELTRSFASCMLGVDKVCICVVIFAATQSLVSLLTGKLSAKYGRNLPFLTGFLVELVTYCFCLTWLPSQDTTALVYVIFLLFGISSGILVSLVNATFGHYLSEQKSLALNFWNLWMNLGYFIQFAISKFACVYVKIYLQIGLLVTSFIGYGISQRVYYR
ncbi:protein unc-93 homolog A-like isoform X2 [Clavelina lepadiformis]|uniref:Uncharacterized protein n=1 Tax=Clavelina lepadiformis TaxID=159417 RepID=A0ABP0GL78_CLALP